MSTSQYKIASSGSPPCPVVYRHRCKLSAKLSHRTLQFEVKPAGDGRRTMNSGQDLRQSSYLRHVSRSYAAASAATPPALTNRAALVATQHHNQYTSAPVSFAARAALLADSSNSQASLDMFRRLSGTHQPR